MEGKNNPAFEEDDAGRGSTSSSSDQSAECEQKMESSKVAMEEEDRERELWDRPVEFVMSCIAMSVGLGNFWRFPTIAFQNGGGAFLIPYLIVLFFIGRPLYFLEFSIGQFASQGSVKVWNMAPAFKGIGYMQGIATYSVATYYVSIIAIAMFYLVMSFSSTLPWSVCDPAWANMDTCIEVSAPEAVNGTVVNITAGETSAEQYFKYYLLQQPPDLSNGPGLPDWRLTICLFVAWLSICAMLIRGVKSSGKVAYVTALFPYVGVITLLISNSTLPGASEGVMYFITPQWEKILEAEVWYQAVTQCFFSLSVAYGPITIFASHNPYRHNIYRDATIISLMDTFNSLLSGFTIFSVLGYLKYITKADSFDQIVTGGTTLVFVAYPTAIAAFETVPQLISVLFFLVLLTLGFGSATALTSCVINIIQDKFHKVPEHYITTGVCVAGFLIGLVYVTPGGQWILDLVDFFGGGFIIYIIAILQTVAVFWVYGSPKYFRDMRFMLQMNLGFYWKFCYVFFIPVGLGVIFIYFLVLFKAPTYNGGLSYPVSGYVCGWVLFGCAMLMLPMSFFISYRQTESSLPLEKLRDVFRPNKKHRPRLEADNEAWQMFCEEEKLSGIDGSDRLDLWKAMSKEALESPQKLKKFNSFFDSIKEECASWDTFRKVRTPSLPSRLWSKIRNRR